MTDQGKVSASHRGRDAIVYIRQSTMTQVEAHRESTERQYALVDLQHKEQQQQQTTPPINRDKLLALGTDLDCP